MLNATPTNKTCTHTKVAYAHTRETSAHIKETYRKDLSVCGLSVLMATGLTVMINYPQ